MKVQTTFCKDINLALNKDHVSKEDTPQYILCAETWCTLFYDVAGLSCAYQLATAVCHNGLYACIRTADAYAKYYLSEGVTDTSSSYDMALGDLWSEVIYKCNESHCMDRIVDPTMVGLVDPEAAGAAICQILLRFPKRFTSVNADPAESIAKFKKVHHETYLYGIDSARWPGDYILRLLKRNMREILIPTNVIKLRHAIKEYNESQGFFSDGACFVPWELDEDGNLIDAEPGFYTTKDRAEKYEYLLCYDDLFTSFPWQSTFGYLPNVNFTYRDLGPTKRRWAMMSAVPKDYESSRIIAPNTPYLNFKGSRVRVLLLALTEATGALAQMPPEDQSLNRSRAYEGSLPQDDPYCTIDLSHASDSISRSFFRELCPPELWPIIADCLEDTIFIERKPYKPALLATSGNKLTPFLQSTFFLTILRTACDLCNAPRDVSAYNDDLVCRRSVFPTVCELLTLCGATVNLKKTFSEGYFRESCGGEYCYGVDVTGYYWPRRALALAGKVDDASTIQSLIALQKKLYHFTTTRTLIEGTVKSIVPDMTYSPYLKDCEDLWAGWCTDRYDLTHPHFSFRQKKSGITRFAAGEDFAQYRAYLAFLKEGPVYASPLDELLHISAPANSRNYVKLSQERVINPPLVDEAK